MSALKIGHAARQYPEVRNIIGCVEGASYHLCRDYYSLLRRCGPLLGVDPSSDRFLISSFSSAILALTGWTACIYSTVSITPEHPG